MNQQSENLLPLLGTLVITGVAYLGLKALNALISRDEDSVDKQANEYFPVESDSEVAAGHPLVGAS